MPDIGRLTRRVVLVAEAVMIELYLRGDQIATFTGLSSSGNANGVKVTLTGVQPLGTASDTFRVVVTQVGPGQTAFLNGQMVAIHAWPDSDPPAPPLFSGLNPQHDQFQGRASSDGHTIFTSPAQVVFDVAGLAAGTKQYGPGVNPPRDQQLPFAAFPGEPPAIPCFAAGTRMATPDGPRPVERLRAGELVVTLDGGPRPLRWVGGATVAGIGPFAPVVFAPGALGNVRPLVLSALHRVLIDDWRAQLYFGEDAVLVAARHLVGWPGVVRRMVPRITYVHLLFERHEIVLAEGVRCESLHPDVLACAAPDGLPEALLGLFPPPERGAVARHQAARRCLTAAEAAVLAPGGGLHGRSSRRRSPEAKRRSTMG